jgi:uncharacterized protein with ParB-like and HNH nuclease domain
MKPVANIDIKLLGIGKLLTDMRMGVPPNQREYAWREKNVTDLLDDLKNAIANENP